MLDGLRLGIVLRVVVLQAVALGEIPRDACAALASGSLFLFFVFGGLSLLLFAAGLLFAGGRHG